jgi:hypothetical protein
VAGFCEHGNELLDPIKCWEFHENRMLRIKFGQNRDEIIGAWRKLHNVELHNMYSLSNEIKMMKSRSMRRAEHAACMEENRNA